MSSPRTEVRVERVTMPGAKLAERASSITASCPVPLQAKRVDGGDLYRPLAHGDAGLEKDQISTGTGWIHRTGVQDSVKAD